MFLPKAAVLSVALSIPLLSAAAPWQLRMDGIGPLKIGMRSSAANKSVGNTIKRDEPGPMPAQGCTQVGLRGHPGIALMFIDDVLARVDLYQPGLKTKEGVAVGDPVKRVPARYPDAKSEPNKYDAKEHYFTSQSGDGRLAMRFETRHGKIARAYAGQLAAVQLTEGCS
jgi:hypothetical protein